MSETTVPQHYSDPQEVSAHREQLSAQLATMMAATGIPGVAVGMIHGGQRLTACAGVTNRNHPLSVTADTLFQIGSITKTMTATVALRLVEAGLLDLDRPIRDYVPGFQLQDKNAARHATMRHLFTHLGGWVGDYFENTGAGDDALARYVANMAALPQQTPLGTIWSYNNAGFSLAGHLMATVAGKSYEQLMQEELFTPLGMTMTYLFPSDVMVHRFAVGHMVTERDGVLMADVATPWPLARSAYPAGAVVSTVNDMLDYAQFHLAQGATKAGAQWLPQSVVNAMQEPLAEAGSMATHVGISWLLNKVDGVWTVGHGGATNGQIAQLLLVPEHAFALVILTNANRGRELNRDLTEWSLAHFLNLRASAPVIQPCSAETLATFTGYYRAQLSDIEVTSDGEHLLLQVIPNGGFPEKDSPPGPKPPVAPAAFVATDRLLVLDGPSKGSRAELIRSDEGLFRWLRFGGRIHERRM